MKFSTVIFREQLEISGLPQSNRYLLRAIEGFELEHDPASGGVIAKHAQLPEPLWIPALQVRQAYVLAEPAAPKLKAAK